MKIARDITFGTKGRKVKHSIPADEGKVSDNGRVNGTLNKIRLISGRKEIAHLELKCHSNSYPSSIRIQGNREALVVPRLQRRASLDCLGVSISVYITRISAQFVTVLGMDESLPKPRPMMPLIWSTKVTFDLVIKPVAKYRKLSERANWTDVPNA